MENEIDEGLEGSIRNALERGENLNTAAQSLVNAGYDMGEVQKAAAKFSGEVSGEQKEDYYKNQVKKLPGSQVVLVKKKSKKWIIILIIFFMILIISAGFLALFWSDFFG